MPLVKGLALWSGLLLVGLLAVFSWVSDRRPPAQAQEPKRYLYRVIEVPADTFAMQQVLNEHGAAGWELIVVEMAEMATPRMIFKK
ncbi:hypothetical protein [Nitrospira moscoviensis]|uniref:DUF4177 domain-containing protein n=1 Tax=Nitrospira moscoviensis TaxID=42253 RepID=A0A0K2GEI1_NITMO|nr:hypothetical protein [Nitrospira moscoviensis]ALA59002.1 exported protein of unknown function [Nitrospira moscoviensis]